MLAGRGEAMQRLIAKRPDPMIVVLVLATAIAVALPAAGEAQAHARTVSNVSIFVLFLVNGMRIARGQVASAATNWRFFAVLILFVFGAMALAGKGFGALAGTVLPPTLALGFVFLAVLPSTIQSATSYTTLAGGNVALSVVGAAVLNIVGVFASAPLFALLAGGDLVDLGCDTFIRIGAILILPFAIGQLLLGYTRPWLMERKADIVWLDRLVIGIAVYVAMSGAVEQGVLTRLSLAQTLILFALVCAYLALAHMAAWQLARWRGYPREDRIAFLFGAPQKSVAIGAPLATIMFPPAIAGAIIAPLLLYHLLQLVMAAPLATRLARPPTD